jgi:hypothetical protein
MKALNGEEITIFDGRACALQIEYAESLRSAA